MDRSARFGAGAGGQRIRGSVGERPVDDRAQLRAEVEGPAGQQLGEKDHDEIFDRVDPEGGAGRAPPGELPGAANGAGAEAGGRAGRVADTKQSQKWLVASTLGTKAARKMALEHKPRGWVPLAQVGRCFSGGRACLDPSWGARAVCTRASVCISVRVCVGGGPGGELQRGHAGRGRAALCLS